MNKTRTRRLRRKSRATQNHGPAAGPTHKLRTGRTGTIHSKKTPPKSHGRRVTIVVVVPPYNWTQAEVRAFNNFCFPSSESAPCCSARVDTTTVAAHREGRPKGGAFQSRRKP